MITGLGPALFRIGWYTHHKLRYGQWLALLVQGYIGEEGTGGPVPLL